MYYVIYVLYMYYMYMCYNVWQAGACAGCESVQGHPREAAGRAEAERRGARGVHRSALQHMFTLYNNCIGYRTHVQAL